MSYYITLSYSLYELKINCTPMAQLGKLKVNLDY